MRNNKFKLGDKVAVIDANIIGKITAISKDTITIKDESSFLFKYAPNELVKINTENIMQSSLFKDASVKNVIQSKEDLPKQKTAKKSKKAKYRPALEVDLHIHQLTPSTKGMSNYDMLTLQVETARKQLEFAMQKGIQKVVFIHGVGEGVLKTELEYLFDRYNNVKYYDANYQKYGLGATEVYIYQNTKTH